MSSAFRVVSWNINSVRLRIGLVERVLHELAPDILCLQEIKCRNGEFPAAALKKAGYGYCAVNGQKGYHGVALVSRRPLAAIDGRSFCDKADARHVSARVEVGGRTLTVHNYYVPSGGDEPDPDANAKFAHKLSFLDEMKQLYIADRGSRRSSILVGDLNVAPLETDVWSHRQMLRVVSHTPAETDRLLAILEHGDWVDAIRTRVPPPQRLYTWWSYRSPDWSKSDRGRRLDHIWITPDLKPLLTSVAVLRQARGWDRPSDHVPVVADFMIE